MSTLVSVIIPTYDRRVYVQEAVDSVLAQTYTDYEIIVVDDGSTDGTGEALRARYGDRFRYIWQENQGESVARNRGIEMAHGKYIGFLDSDDLYLPHKLEVQVPVLEEDADVGLVFGRARIIDEEGKRIGDRFQGDCRSATSFDTTELYFRNPIGGPSTTLIRKAIFDYVGVFDPAIRFGEEWDLWLRIVGESQVVALNEILACIRRHRGGQSHYPNPVHNSQRLADRVRMLQKAFERDDVSHEIRRRALARQYGQAFLWEEAVGNREGATQNLCKARDLNDCFVADPQGLGQLITNHVSRLADGGDALNFDGALDALQSILGRWREVVEANTEFEDVILGQVYAAFSFMASQALQFDRARRYALLAIRRDWRWLRNHGLLKGLLKGSLPRFLQNQ